MAIQARDYALIMALAQELPALFDVLVDADGIYTHDVRIGYGKRLYHYVGVAANGKVEVRRQAALRVVTRYLGYGQTVILVHRLNGLPRWP